jgi:hypothetical protein
VRRLSQGIARLCRWVEVLHAGEKNGAPTHVLAAPLASFPGSAEIITTLAPMLSVLIVDALSTLSK